MSSWIDLYLREIKSLTMCLLLNLVIDYAFGILLLNLVTGLIFRQNTVIMFNMHGIPL